MRIDEIKHDKMFVLAGVSKTTLHDALRTMGTKHLKDERMRKMWRPETPTINYCYTVCEFVYWYVLRDMRDSWSSYITDIPSLPGIKHWFLRDYLGVIIDLTADQFDNHNEIDYNNATCGAFLQTGVIGPSRRARMLAKLMGRAENSWKRNERNLEAFIV